MKDKVLAVLKNTDGYVSGQELCEELGVSRTAVWKAVNALKEAGYEIESVRNRGYMLKSCPDVLLSEEIKSVLDTKWFANKILYFDEIDSTNSEIKRQAEQGASEGTLAIAEYQSAGRGRRGRSWDSPAGSGIWMSFLIKPDIRPEHAPMITLLAAMACASAVRDVTGLEAMIKWPNDIVIGGRKITGILTEMSTEMETISYIVVGIGINANMTEFPEDIRKTATSLAIECKEPVSRSLIVASFGHYFEQYYEIFINDLNMSSLKDIYESMLVNKGAEVAIIGKSGTIRRRAVGINDEGELLVEDDEHNITAVRAGEVSVRGIYGYV